MAKRIAILQSNYIPWKGYFDLINSVNEFILYDTVQFTKNDWRNRNKIKTARGPAWLTIPVRHSFERTLMDRVWQWEQTRLAPGQAIPCGTTCLAVAERVSSAHA